MRTCTTGRTAPLFGWHRWQGLWVLCYYGNVEFCYQASKRQREKLCAHSTQRNCSVGERERLGHWPESFFFFNHLLGLPKFPFHCTRINIRRYITACMHISIQSRGGGQFVRSLYILGTCVRQRLTCGRKEYYVQPKAYKSEISIARCQEKKKKKSEKKSSITTEVRHLASFASGH